MKTIYQSSREHVSMGLYQPISCSGISLNHLLAKTIALLILLCSVTPALALENIKVGTTTRTIISYAPQNLPKQPALLIACHGYNQDAPYLQGLAKIENIDYISMAESMDIGSVINKKLIAASYIYQFLLDVDVSNVKCLTFANADVAELVARPNSKITKKQVKDLHLPKDMTLGGMIRDGEPMMIKGDTQIQAYDHVVVFCLDTAMRKLEDFFN